jgi:hypothetical protein
MSGEEESTSAPSMSLRCIVFRMTHRGGAEYAENL